MNKKQLIPISGLIFSLLLSVMGMSTVGNTVVEIDNQLTPVRAPAPVPSAVKSTPEPVQRVASQPMPQPQPVPVPPGLESVSLAKPPARSTSASVLPLLFFMGTVGLFIGLLVILSRRWKENGRFSETPILAKGAQS